MKKKFILAAICALGFISEIPQAQAVYQSKSDTGTEIFDYIENRRREQRANALTDDQIQLLADIDSTFNAKGKFGGD